MVDDQNKSNGASSGDEDDAYVLEDTGESLSDFDLKKEEAKAKQLETDPAGADAAELASLRKETQSLRDQVLRARADFENFRRRAEREKNDFYKFALSDVMRDVLPVIDNFERALSIPAGEAGDDYRKGIELIYKQLSDVLGKYGLKPIDEANVPFDPTIHEAVTREETDAYPSHTVVDVLQKGYFLNERLVRPAMVRVSVGGPERSPGGKTD